MDTPQKSIIDTKNGHILKESTFSKPSFWVSMLVFGDVPKMVFCVWSSDLTGPGPEKVTVKRRRSRPCRNGKWS